MLRPNPCKDCVTPKRCIGCHATCKDYVDWQEENEQHKRLVRSKRYEHLPLNRQPLFTP